MIPARGLPKLVRIGPVRQLRPEDTPQLREPRSPPRVVKFREAHHRLAMLIAQGHVIHDIVRLTGYTAHRVYTLNSDPAFQDLVAQKRAIVEQDQADADSEYTEEIRRLRMASIRHKLQYVEELDEVNETMPIRVAIALGEFTADRTGFGKHTSQTNTNVNIGVSLEDRIRKFNKLREVKAVAIPGPPPEPGPATTSADVVRVLSTIRRRI